MARVLRGDRAAQLYTGPDCRTLEKDGGAEGEIERSSGSMEGTIGSYRRWCTGCERRRLR